MNEPLLPQRSDTPGETGSPEVSSAPSGSVEAHQWQPAVTETNPVSNRRRTKRGNLLRLVGIAAGCSLLIAAIVQVIPASLSSFFQTSPRPAVTVITSNPMPQAAPATPTTSKPPAPRPPSTGEVATVPQPARQASNSVSRSLPVDLVSKVHHSVVQIESDDPSGQRLVGTGFVITSEGDIATSYHVAMEVGQGTIRFYDGRTFEIAGYSACSPESDLAILRTKVIPTDLVPLPLASARQVTSTSNATPVVAAGHPEGVPFLLSQGKISQSISTSKLSSSAKRFVASLTTPTSNPTWLQHTARLADGSSGGPLLSLQGKVLGINTWVDPQSGYSFALDASILSKLVAQMQAANTGDSPKGLTPLLDLASPAVKRNYLLWQTSGATLKDLCSQARQFRFSPKTQSDYQLMQRLALGITIAHHSELLQADDTHQSTLDDLAREADQALAEIEKQKWRDIGFITLLNEFAAPTVAQPMMGQFLLATTHRVVEGQGKKGLLVKLAGFDDWVLLPLTPSITVPPLGSQVLILGANLEGQSIPFGDNPLALNSAHIITPALILPLNP